MSKKKDLPDILPVAGKELPAAKRRDELRASVLADTAGQAAAPAARVRKPIYRSRLAVAGGIALCVIVVLVIVGAVSMSAKPGDTLYGVKRFLQRTRVVLAIGSGAKSNASRANADARLADLRYARSKDMTDWYAPLAKSAASDLQQSIQGASPSATKTAQEKLKELRDLSRDIGPSQDSGLQKAMDGLQQQINQQYDQRL